MTLVVLACVTDASTLTELMMVAIFFDILIRELFAIRVRVLWLLKSARFSLYVGYRTLIYNLSGKIKLSPCRVL